MSYPFPSRPTFPPVPKQRKRKFDWESNVIVPLMALFIIVVVTVVTFLINTFWLQYKAAILAEALKGVIN